MTIVTPNPSGDTSGLIRKLWQYCNILRDDGLSYPDYVEQLTYLLFLKMSDELEDGPVPVHHGWQSFAYLGPEAMHRQYTRALSALGGRDGMLGLIFRNAKNKIRDPAKLRLLVVGLIGQTEWADLSTDLKGDAYEGLLEKNARDTKSGAGQYFTPRALVKAIVQCVDPQPGEVVCDPACGTGGFLLAAHQHIRERNPDMSPAQQRHLRTKAMRGIELVEEVARLATMNLLLHGIAGEAEDELPIACTDSLRQPPHQHVDIVLTNPPFGVRGSVTYSGKERRSQRVNDDLTIVRRDFWVNTANKQLNFLQHVKSSLKPGGRAAVVLPDNVLFESGAAAVIRRRLLETCDVHTLLRLPTGLFYAQGVKANVLFFDRLMPGREPSTSVWTYDLRSDNRFSLKTNPLRDEDLQEFVKFYSPGAREEREELPGSARWRAFSRDQVMRSDECSWDLTWPAHETPGSPSLERLDEISKLIAGDLQRALGHIANVSDIG
jgi:type I restriction enzyme M protein